MRPVVVHAVVPFPFQPLDLLLLAHLIVGHLLDREGRRVRRQLRQRPVERQPERLAQTPTQLYWELVMRSDNNLKS